MVKSFARRVGPCEAANKDDKLAVELLSEAGYNIGRGVVILIPILNLEIIVLNGHYYFTL